MRGEPIRVGRLIAQSIKRMVITPEVYVGHPFIITHLCETLGVPTRSNDDIRRPVEPIGKRFFAKVQRAADIAYAAQAAPPAAAPHLPPPHQQQHQVPPHIPQHHQYTDFEMGMAVSQYNMAWRMDTELP
ncbi:hypothetical protein A2U01_0044730 [Trifolium medium]|uniref:Uncharacterized protein n=1 Tax=Trifolium medium TaxID=97028 RepID=A0A392QHX3_9FABA|nr:hypothetical protein [Trifolium medium]